MNSRLGIDLRCLPADGTAGSGVAHAARGIAYAMAQMGVDAVYYVPRGALFEVGEREVVELTGTRREDLLVGLQKHPCQFLLVLQGAVSPRLPVPAIPWVHDVEIFDHPDWFPQSWFKRLMTTTMFLGGLRAAPLIFAVSDHTRVGIEKLVPSLHERIVVTGEGGDEVLMGLTDAQREIAKRDARSRLATQGVARSFALVLGTVEPRKNIDLVCDVWPGVTKIVSGVDLVIAGQDGWKVGPIKRSMERCSSATADNDSHLIRLSEVSDEIRRDLLLAASVVLVPSWSEGFGLVALEAIQAGTPVLTSDRGALPEVVGRGEWTIDPADRVTWSAMVAEVLTNPMTRERIITAQSRVRSRWTWQRSARVMLDRISVL